MPEGTLDGKTKAEVEREEDLEIGMMKMQLLQSAMHTRPNKLWTDVSAPKAFANESVAHSFDFSNWMGSLLDLIGDMTILDLALPASHDAMTADLSTIIPKNADLASINAHSQTLHFLTSLADLLGISLEFLRDQAKNQRLSLTDQLNSGVRFLDFRIILSVGGFYGVHFLQTQKSAKDHLNEIKAWMDAHPKEVVVMWWSSHGDGALGCDGTANRQYPGNDDDTAKFWDDFVINFKDILVNVKENPVNSTKVKDLVSKGQRLLVYGSGLCELIRNQPNCPFVMSGATNVLLNTGVVDDFGGAPGNLQRILNDFSGARQKLKETKKNNQFYARQLVSSASIKAMGANFMIEANSDTLLNIVCGLSPPKWEKEIEEFIGACPRNVKGAYTACAEAFNIPSSPNSCPRTLWDQATLTNYYAQWPLHEAHKRGYEFPNAVYMDAIHTDGTVLAGWTPETGVVGLPVAAILLHSNVRKSCGGSTQGRCGQVLNQLNELIGEPQTWNHFDSLRYKGAPTYSPGNKGAKGGQVCTDPVRVYACTEPCTGSEQCKSNHGLLHCACPLFPSIPEKYW